MSATLETLEMTAQELESCTDAVRKMAYVIWLEAGQPEGKQLEFWLQAERQWIERSYVPHRTLDGTRPDGNQAMAQSRVAEDEKKPGQSKADRRTRAKVQIQ